jgi:hypothetical protein
LILVFNTLIVRLGRSLLLLEHIFKCLKSELRDYIKYFEQGSFKISIVKAERRLIFPRLWKTPGATCLIFIKNRGINHLSEYSETFLARKWDCEYFAYLQKLLKVKLFGVLKHRIKRYEIFIIPMNVFFCIKLENGVKLFFRTGYFFSWRNRPCLVLYLDRYRSFC